MFRTYITVRTEFEGFHYYKDAGEIDPRIKFLESNHRHMFKVKVKIAVTHLDRELEFFLVKWKVQEFLQEREMNGQSCEMMAQYLIERLHHQYGDRYYEVTVSEDGESDGVVEYIPEGF